MFLDLIRCLQVDVIRGSQGFDEFDRFVDMKVALFNVTSTMDRLGSSEVGGVEVYTFRLAEALVARGHEVTLVGGKARENLQVSLKGVTVKCAPFLATSKVPDLGTRFQRLVQRLHFAWKTRHWIREGGYDAILIFKPYDFLTAWLWRWMGVKSRIVASLHGAEFFATDRWFAQWVDVLYAVNESAGRQLSLRYGKKCDWISNFIDTKKFQKCCREKDVVSPIILSVGRMVPVKGMESLIRVFARIHQRRADTKLVLVGDGPERVRLEVLAKELKIERALEWTGVLSEDEIMKQHRRCWIYVQPSIGEETFCLSALEALASGLSVLTSDGVKVAEYFQPGCAIETYRMRDDVELEQKLEAMLNESWEENQTRGERARLIVEQRFSEQNLVKEVEGLLNELR